MRAMMLDQDEYFIQKALLLAKKAESASEVPVGAVIVCDNKIIAEGWNQPIQSRDPSAHAEIVAIRNAAAHLNNYRLNDTTLYVTLEPCMMCVGAMIHARIGRLVFGACDPKTGAVKSVFQLLDDVQHNHAMQWEGGICAETCAQLLKNFFRQKRR